MMRTFNSLAVPLLVLFQFCCLEHVTGFQSVQNTRQSLVACLHALQEEQCREASTLSSWVDRKKFLSLASVLAIGTCFPAASQAKSYSENAANLERINAGDFSGGAVFNNNPTTEGAKKRRAMTGCKTPIAREEAAQAVLKQKSLGEKECNTMVMGGDTEFMLQALRNLDCPTCPNGIASSRPKNETS